MAEYIAYPYDVLFFRGNKAFHFGEWYTEGVFPPYPSTFQGFVRAKVLSDMGMLKWSGVIEDSDKAKATNAVGDDSSSPLNILGPFLAERNGASGEIEMYFRTPRDVMWDKRNERFFSVFTASAQMLESDLDYELCCPQYPPEKFSGVRPPEFISLSELVRYRINSPGVRIGNRTLKQTEARVGISLDRDKLDEGNRRAEESRFFTTPYNRLNSDVGLYFSVSPVAPNEGALKLGSESHLVYVEKIPNQGDFEKAFSDSRMSLIDSIWETRRFKIILLQPGIFTDGWLPFSSPSHDGSFDIGGLKLRLLFASTDSPLKISGYSFQKNAKAQKQDELWVKPMKNAVPAGAVYLFEIHKNSDKARLECFVGKYDNQKIPFEQYHSMGFNHVMLAAAA